MRHHWLADAEQLEPRWALATAPFTVAVLSLIHI